MDSTLRDRYTNTLKLLNNKEISPVEAAIYLYYFARFEIAADRCIRAQRRLKYFHKKLDDNLEVIKLRMQMINL